MFFQHWAKRMGNKNINVKTSRGTNMSTVGVDIGDWVYEKKIRGQSSYGPVVFRYVLKQGLNVIRIRYKQTYRKTLLSKGYSN